MKIFRVLIVLLAVLTVPLSAWALQDSQNPQDWYARGRADLEDGELIFKKASHYEQVCFLAHQSVEKTLKGSLIAQNILPEKKHLTADLMSQLLPFRPELGTHLSEARALDLLYVPSRYPKPGITFTKEKASDCLEKARGILGAVEKEANLISSGQR